MSVRVIAVGLALACNLFGAERWIRVVSPNFELFTDGGASTAHGTLSRFEMMRSLFLTTSRGLVSLPVPVRVFLFNDNKEYLAYGEKNTGGFYESSAERDLIGMNGESETAYGMVMKALVYANLRHFALPLPIWVRAGLSEFYSSVRISGLQAVLGAPIPSNIAYLQHRGIMKVSKFFEVHEGLYTSADADEKQRFFAESWAVTHLVMLNEQYRESAHQLFVVLASGSTAPEAFRKVYDKSLDQVDRDLDKHLLLRSFRGLRIDIERPDATGRSPAQRVSRDDIELALTEVLAARNGHEDQARHRFLALSDRLPTDPRPHTGLAFIALRQRRTADARQEFERAFELGCDSGAAHYSYALLIHSNSKGAEQHLQRAVTLNPNHFDAWRALAQLAESQRQHELAIRYLTAALKLKPYDVGAWVAVARASAAGGHAADARLAEKTARQFAMTPVEKRLVEQLDQQLAATLGGK